MFPRGLLSARARSEGGFTLVELLVVIVVTAILVSIATAVFLNQRNKARVATVRSVLKSAAVAADAWAGDHDGDYSGLDNDGVTKLRQSGLRSVAGVELAVAATESEFCILAEYGQLPASDPWRVATYEPADGGPSSVDTCGSTPTPTLPAPGPTLPVPLPTPSLSISVPALP